MSIADGLTTGPQPSVDDLLAGKEEQVRSRNPLVEDQQTSVSELKQFMLAADGVRGGLEEVRDLDPGEASYERFVNSEEANQLATAERDRDTLVEEALQGREYVAGAALGMTLRGDDYEAFPTHEAWQKQAVAQWAEATPYMRQVAIEDYELTDDIVQQMDEAAQAYREQLAAENLQLREQVSAAEQFQSGQRVLAEYGIRDGVSAAHELNRIEADWNATPGLPPFRSYPPAQLAENVRGVKEFEKQWAKAERDAAEKRAIIAADSGHVADGYEVLGANGEWVSKTPQPKIEPRLSAADFAAIAARTKAQGAHMSVAQFKAELVAESSKEAEWNRLQRKATSLFGAEEARRQERDRARFVRP